MNALQDRASTSVSRSKPRLLLPLLALAAAVGVANLYYAQPLAAVMATSLGVSQTSLGATLMLTQLGYAIGMVLLVPLGDGRERRALIVVTALGASVALLLVAASPGVVALGATSLVLGFASSLPQMVVPFAVGVVPNEQRGRAIGIVMGGLLAGILLSRTASGAIGAAIGWRLTFVGAAAVMAALALVLRVALPEQRPPEPLPWTRILASLGSVVRSEPLLRKHAAIGALGFAAFSVFWSTLAFHLATRGYGSRVAGLFGAIGVVGVTVAPIVGRLAARVRATRINLVGLALVAVAFLVFHAEEASLLGLGAGVVLLDAGAQASHLANQNIIFGLRPALRNRINAVYMVTYFVGGALGSAVGAAAWGIAGWSGVCASGALLAIAALTPLLARRGPYAS